MIVGNKSILAIESEVSRAYERLSCRALGFFVIYVNGQSYGVREPEATMLACSFDEVERRIIDRGHHVAPFVDATSEMIVNAYITAIYGENYDDVMAGLGRDEFCNLIQSHHIVWAPDGDAAFDDRSHVLQFDASDRVRIIAFKRVGDCLYDPSTLVDIWLPCDEFYSVLRDWHTAFIVEWGKLQKVPENKTNG